MKALVNLKLPGAFMGESEVLQVVETDRKLRMEEIFTHFINQAMEEKKEEAKQESKASRWEKARPRSLEYYNQVFLKLLRLLVEYRVSQKSHCEYYL